MLKKIVVLIIVFSGLGACTPVSHHSSQTVNIIIDVVEPDRIRFFGKGAGAGVMLSSSMGPMGVAIGVAIDEGIGKTIDEHARKSNFDIRNTIERSARNVLSDTQTTVPKKNTIKMVLERYGFVTRPGDNDPVAPQIHITFNGRLVRFPEDFDDANIPTAPLDRVKTDTGVVAELFMHAANKASTRLLSASQ